jgi:phosphoribosylanthranilate isomerase
VQITLKICGLTSEEDARLATRAGADVLGFVFFPASRRCLDPTAAAWIRTIKGPLKAGVFRNQPGGFVAAVRDAAGLDLVQLHGEEPPEMCAALGGVSRVIKAVSVADRIDWEAVSRYAKVALILFDTASASGGGTGRCFDWTLLGDAPPELAPWLAGGLRPDNVAAAIRRVRPSGVDVASGVELAPGRKDPTLMAAFVTAARRAGEELEREVSAR